MANVYCSQCGSKHILGVKFCSSCGFQLSGVSVKQNTPFITPVIKSVETNTNSHYDEDGIPTVFVKPRKLSYEIEAPSNNKYNAKDLFHAQPSEREGNNDRVASNYKKLTKEEFLSQSIRECSSKKAQDIDES